MKNKLLRHLAIKAGPYFVFFAASYWYPPTLPISPLPMPGSICKLIVIPSLCKKSNKKTGITY